MFSFLKRDLSIPHHLRSPQDSVPLPLNFFLSHGIAFKIKHPPTWSFQVETLIFWKVLSSLEVAQDLVHPIHDKHVFLSYPAVKLTGFSGCVCWPSHKESARLIRPHTFFILELRIERSLLRVSLPSGSSPLESVVSNAWGTIRDEFCSMRATRSKRHLIL